MPSVVGTSTKRATDEGRIKISRHSSRQAESHGRIVAFDIRVKRRSSIHVACRKNWQQLRQSHVSCWRTSKVRTIAGVANVSAADLSIYSMSRRTVIRRTAAIKLTI